MAQSSFRPPPPPAEIEAALVEARDLAVWWERSEKRMLSRAAGFDSFELLPAAPEAGLKPTIGFFADASVGGKPVPVMGQVTDAFFDRPMVRAADKKEAPERFRAQAQEFALHYWLRNQVDVLPEPLPELGRPALPPYLELFSWSPSLDLELQGVNHVQKSFKTASGELGTFPESEALRIVDLRQLGPRYKWVQLNRQLLSFDLTLTAGSQLSLIIPLRRTVPVVMDAQLAINRTHPAPGVLGEYGVGFARIACPAGLLRFGPDKDQPGLDLQFLRILDSGEIRLRSVTIVAVPAKLLDVSWNPLRWSLGAVDFFSLGMTRAITRPVREALDQLPGVPLDLLKALSDLPAGSKREFLQEILAQEASRNLRTLLATRQVWMTGSDWLNPLSLPPWIHAGGPPQPPVPDREGVTA